MRVRFVVYLDLLESKFYVSILFIMTMIMMQPLAALHGGSSGERPPMTAWDWQVQYDRYRASPEFKKLHSTMTLDEFKFIFWMEYAHR